MTRLSKNKKILVIKETKETKRAPSAGLELFYGTEKFTHKKEYLKTEKEKRQTLRRNLLGIGHTRSSSISKPIADTEKMQFWFLHRLLPFNLFISYSPFSELQ